MASAVDELGVVALGSNLGGAFGAPDAMLEAALEALSAQGLPVLARSRLWRSAAWPDPAAPPFLNAVALVEPVLRPAEMLALLHAVERAFGRDRSERDAPRTLDLDLIAHGRTVLRTPGLTLPHPRAAERRFVMGPLAEIAPGWRHPVCGHTAAELAMAATVGRDARPV